MPLGERQWSSRALPGDRWLRVDAEHRLVAIDGATGTPRSIDTDVGSPAVLLPAPSDLPAHELVYFVDDPTSDRHGLWRAAFSE